jgi:transposase
MLAAKDARIDALLVQVAELTAQVQALVLKLSRDSSTSSKPPSSDGPDRRPRGGSSRTASGRKPGKQPGDPGTALRLVDDPDERIAIPAPAACACGTSLVEQPVAAVRRRQVHDLPPAPDPVVTEYAADVKCCPGCRAAVTGRFPAGVNAPAQYGPEITTRVADVVVGHHVPVHRSTVLVMELLGLQVSTGFAASLRARAARLITEGGFLTAVKKLLAAAPVVHADETFARAGGATAYVHVACTAHLTLLHTGNRSADAIDAGGVLTGLGAGQVLVRDGYAGYAHLTDVLHAWCGQHLLRDLRGIHEADPAGQLWRTRHRRRSSSPPTSRSSSTRRPVTRSSRSRRAWGSPGRRSPPTTPPSGGPRTSSTPAPRSRCSWARAPGAPAPRSRRSPSC